MYAATSAHIKMHLFGFTQKSTISSKRLFVCYKVIAKKRPEEFELFRTAEGYILTLLVSCYICKGICSIVKYLIIASHILMNRV